MYSRKDKTMRKFDKVKRDSKYKDIPSKYLAGAKNKDKRES